MTSLQSPSRIALFGNVNTEEILARRLVSEGSIVDGYLRFPNDAFARSCRNVRMLTDEYVSNGLVPDLLAEHYDAISLGPDFIVPMVSRVLRDAGIAHIGATPEQIAYETDKRLIRKVFAGDANILAPYLILTAGTENELREALERLGQDFVLKFVGDYSQKYGGSPVGRVRFSGETIGELPEVLEFVRNSIDVSGGCIIEKRIVGTEFSSNYALDGNGELFKLGENICYKRRGNGDTGPICDGCGSITINNSLPFLTPADITFIEESILRPFAEHVRARTGVPLRALLNIDLMKTEEERISLFEINCREAGGHTMANILPLLETRLTDVLVYTQNDRLSEITPSFGSGATVVVSAFPPYFPAGLSSDEEMMVLEVPKTVPKDVSMYTGWVEVIAESETTRTLRLFNSPSLLFSCSAPTLESARSGIYMAIEEVVQGRLDYRTDMGTASI